MLLSAAGINKSFHNNPVLEGVDFEVRAGEVHALIGENGAGKSTLINVISGVHQRDSGTIELEGRPVNFSKPMEAMSAGISVVHQELSLVPRMTVAENIYLRREKTNAFGLNDWRAMNAAASEVFERMGVDIDPTEFAGSLSVGLQQMVEVAKAIALDARLVIMDEPTSSLSDKDTKELFKVIRSLRQLGLGIVFVSHKLSELFEISDRITVLRDGRYIGTRETAQASSDDIIRMMVGRPLSDLYPPRASAVGPVVLQVKGLNRYGIVRDVSFQVAQGEILVVSA